MKHLKLTKLTQRELHDLKAGDEQEYCGCGCICWPNEGALEGDADGGAEDGHERQMGDE